jgi:hypothetical protein
VKSLNNRHPDRDWYRYLVSRLMPTSSNDFAANQLRIITFNFETLI